MEIGNIAEWASIGWAVLSGIFMLFSWYQASGSKKAKAEAAAAVKRAETQAQSALAQAHEARKQTEEIRRIANSFQGPPLTLTKISRSGYALCNTTQQTLTITEIVNIEAIHDIVGWPKQGLTLRPHQSHRLCMGGLKGSRPLPTHLHLRVEELPEVFQVPIFTA